MATNLKSNFLDRVIGYFSPAAEFRRAKTRAASALVGGYVGGQYSDRLSKWKPGNGDADASAVFDLQELRNRSSDLIRNSPIAAGAIETQVAHVVGTGLSMKACIDASFLGMTPEQAKAWNENTNREFCVWAESTFSDALQQLTFYEQQDLALRSSLEKGDSFTVLASVDVPNWPYNLALQIVEADRVSNPFSGQDIETRVQGIEKTEAGVPIAAHICNRHPGTYRLNFVGLKWERVAFRGDSGRLNLIQLFRKKRPGQTRGIPELAPVIEPLKQLSRYTDAEIAAAVVAGAFSVFVKMDPETFTDLFDDDAQKSIINNAKRWDGTLQPGAAVNLLPGEEIQAADASRPNPNFDPFVSAIMRQIGIGLNIPYEVLSKHFQSSYSAARAALMDAWRTFKIRREWLACKWCQPVYEEWLADAVAMGRISAPGFFADAAIRHAWSRAVWTGDGPGAIDPLKEANAVEKRVNIGLTTLAEEIMAYDGGTWEQKHQQRVVEHEARVDSGLEAPATQPMPGAAAPAADTSRNTEDS